MRPSRLRTKLSAREPVLVTTLHFTDPALFEMVSMMGFDGIWLDLEHHGVSVESAANLMRAARVGSADIVARPAKGEFLRMGRLLEVGANAIMYPQCDDAAEAAEVVHWSKFPPTGRRGCDAANADVPYLSMPVAEYTQAANEQTVIIIQIETVEGLRNVDEIAQVDGVDILMLGPGDLSLQLGVPGQFDDPKIMDATQRVADAADRNGKHWGGPVGSTEHAQRYLDRNARFIAFGADIVMVKLGLESMQEDFAKLGFSFNNRLKSIITD